MEKPSVLIVSPTPPPYSGPEIMTQHLLNSTLNDSYHLIHFNISKQRGVATKARFDFINVFYGLFQPLQLAWILFRNRPDLVYTNFAQNLGGFLRYASFILIIALFRRPIVVRVMGDGFGHFYAQAPALLQWVVRLVLGKINIFIVRAEALKHQFAGLVPSEKLQVVHSGIDTEEFNHSRIIEDDKLRVLFVGYLTQAKGAHDLLRAIPIIAAQVSNVVFQLMGERVDIERNITYVENPTSNTSVLDELLARSDTAPYVALLGVRKGQEKIDAFVNADILILPSYSEAFPTVVLEGMAAGLPIVATPVGVLPEVFDEQSILYVEPGNIDQIANALLQLLQDPTRRRLMGSFNRTLCTSDFNLEAYAERVQAVFASCLRNA